MAWIDAGGISMRYERAGSGAPVVLFHELGGSADSWDAVVTHLSGHFETLRYDLRGAGQSEKVRAPFTFETLVDDFVALIDALEIAPPFHLAGIAAGAVLALLVADRRPEWARTLIVCNPAVATSAERTAYLDMRGAAAKEHGMRSVLPLTLGRSFPPQTADDGDVYARYLARYFANDAHCFALMGDALARNTAAEAVARVRCRTLVLAGREDALRPAAESMALARAIPGAQYEVIAGGHFMHVASPGPLIAALDAFLSEG
jgi:3-oxoadipate enol-lactonase